MFGHLKCCVFATVACLHKTEYLCQSKMVNLGTLTFFELNLALKIVLFPPEALNLFE